MPQLSSLYHTGEKMSTLFYTFFQKINQIAPLECDFTEVLESIALKPKTLYFCGKMPENMPKSPSREPGLRHQKVVKSTAQNRTERPKTVAIVGSRHNTRYGEEVAYKMAYELAQRGVVVVSGLAYGIDSIAHRGALDAGGQTVAVLGTRIDDIYPKNHLALAKEILEKDGAIMSEYAPISSKNAPLAPAEAGWDGQNWVKYSDDSSSSTPFIKRRIDRKLSFLQRNRLISGLSDIVVVVEAAERSGSLNTATHALAQGKEVFAVPGNINNPYSQGCNKLIRQGAMPYTEPDDLLRELFPESFIAPRQKSPQLHLFGDTATETAILQSLDRGIRNGEEIIKNSQLTPEEFNEATTLLEIKGRIRSLGANNWSLA